MVFGKCKQVSSALHRINESLDSRVQELLTELSHAHEQLCREKTLLHQQMGANSNLNLGRKELA